jgi:hypothetical protein
MTPKLTVSREEARKPELVLNKKSGMMVIPPARTPVFLIKLRRLLSMAQMF